MYYYLIDYVLLSVCHYVKTWRTKAGHLYSDVLKRVYAVWDLSQAEIC